MKFFHLIICTTLLMAIKASGQSNFKDAIVIDRSGDTLNGAIDYRNWRSNPKSISFRSASGQEKTFTPTDIREFTLPTVNEHYVSASVTVDPLSDNPNKALNDLIADAQEEHAYFLLQLVHHPTASLYLLTLGDRDHFYNRTGQEKPTELIHHFELDKATSQLNEIDLYKGQLASIFTACNGPAMDMERLRYRTEDLRKAYSSYLQCAFGVTPTESDKKESYGVKFGVIAGFSLTRYSFKGDNTFLADDNYSSSTAPVLGGMIDVALSRNLNRLHIVNELVYKNYKTGSTFTRPYNLGYTMTNTVEFNLSYLQLNTMIRYLFAPLSKVNPYVNLGVSNAIMVAESKNSLHIAYSFGSDETTKAIEGIDKYEFTPLVAGIGVNTRSFSAEVRYSYNKRGFSSQVTLETNPRTWWFLFTYKF